MICKKSVFSSNFDVLKANKPYLIAIVGPTAVGKTAVAIALAQRLKTDIVSCDSRQFYREMEIGTAKPSPDELQLVKHHFINTLSVADTYSVKEYEEEAIATLSRLFQSQHAVVMVGGSGLFYKAVCDGLDEIPDVDADVRKAVLQDLEVHGIEALQQELKQRDPLLYSEMDIQNHQRLVRAIEVCRGTGRPFSEFRTGEGKARDFEVIKIGLQQSSAQLYARIDARMEAMLANGLRHEVETLLPFRNHNALQTVGYKEIIDFLDGATDWEECVRLLKRNSRRYAKRQMTWFRKDEAITWYQVDDYADLDAVADAIWSQSLSHLISANQG